MVKQQGERILVETTSTQVIQDWYSHPSGWVLIHQTIYPASKLKSDLKPPRKLLKNPLVPGEKWDYKGTGMMGVSLEEHNLVGPAREVKVAAGTFQAHPGRGQGAQKLRLRRRHRTGPLPYRVRRGQVRLRAGRLQLQEKVTWPSCNKPGLPSLAPPPILGAMEIQRRPIPGSYIVAADSRRAKALSQEVRVEKVLGQSEDTTFLLVQADAPRADFMPNYAYTGDLFDTPLKGNADHPVHLDIIEAARAWEVTRGNPTVTGAITDSGPDNQHPQLQQTLWQNPKEIPDNGLDDDGNGKVDDQNGWDFSDTDNNPRDPEGTHHTHVHGIVCAQPGSGVTGVAPGSKGMDLRIAGGKRPFSSSILVESYLYALKAGVKSINTSFNIDAFVGDKAIATTYRELADQNVLLFNSAGNNSKRNPKRSQFDDLILVASTDTAEATRDQRSDFSNYGVGMDISAPGADILSTLPGGRVGALSGTSMASPVVMGVDLLVQSAHPDWNAAQRWAQIAGTADRLEGDEMGYGRVNAGRALSETLTAPTMTATTQTFPNGQTMELTVRFDKVFDPSSAKDAFQVLNEQGEAVMQGAPKEVRLGTNQLTFNFAKLPIGHYKFVASAQQLRDPFGQPLDGNKDGQPGDDLVVEFQRVA